MFKTMSDKELIACALDVRQSLHMTGPQLAEAVGVSPSTVQNWAHDRTDSIKGSMRPKVIAFLERNQDVLTQTKARNGDVVVGDDFTACVNRVCERLENLRGSGQIDMTTARAVTRLDEAIGSVFPRQMAAN